MDNAVTIELRHRPRRPWLAALLSFLLPGLGQLYAGQVTRAVFWFAFYLFIIMVGWTLRFVPINRLIFAIIVAWVPLALVAIFDAWRVAARQRNYALRRFNRWWIYLGLVLLQGALTYSTGLTLLPPRTVSNFSMSSHSMAPTLLIGDVLVADTYRPRLSAIRNGDVILFQHKGAIFIKRVAGLPGDQVSMAGGVLSINGQALSHQSGISLQEAGLAGTEIEPAMLQREIWPDGRKVLILQQSTDGPLDSFAPLTVPQDQFFVLGDNRDISVDSRTFGLVARDQLVGRVSFVGWSPDLGRIGRQIN